MSEFWSKFKGVFVETDPNAVKQSSATPQSAPTATRENVASPKQTPSVSVPSAPTFSGQGAVNEKFMQALSGAMEAANLDGFDYFEFKLSLKNLASMPMDEATRYKSAFAMASTMGATPEKLINAAIHYLDILKNENAKFSQAAENQRAAQVGNKQSQADNLDAVIKQKAEQIRQLTTEIDQHRKDITKLNDEIGQATVKVAQTQQDFAASYQSLVGQIEQDVTNMKNYLK